MVLMDDMRQDLDVLAPEENAGIPVGMSRLSENARAQEIGADRH